MAKITVNKKMSDALANIFYAACYADWVYPVEHRSHWIDARTGNALVRRGLCVKLSEHMGYTLTDFGFQYCRDVLRFSTPFEPFHTYELQARKMLELTAQTIPDGNPQMWVGVWEQMARRIKANYVDWSKPGGEILDRKMLNKADYYRALVNIVSSWSVN